MLPILFGALTGGTVAVINSRRKGRAESSSLCTLTGNAPSVVLARLVCAIPENALRPFALLFGPAVGSASPTPRSRSCRKWMERRVPEARRARYAGGGLGVMCGVGLLCLAIQVGMTFTISAQVRG